jgi:hypothetical protein
MNLITHRRSKMDNKKTFRLNRMNCSEYALFIVDVDANSVSFRHFEYYTGPTIEEETLTIPASRKQYQDMLNSGEWMAA